MTACISGRGDPSRNPTPNSECCSHLFCWENRMSCTIDSRWRRGGGGSSILNNGYTGCRANPTLEPMCLSLHVTQLILVFHGLLQILGEAARMTSAFLKFCVQPWTANEQVGIVHCEYLKPPKSHHPPQWLKQCWGTCYTLFFYAFKVHSHSVSSCVQYWKSNLASNSFSEESQQ